MPISDNLVGYWNLSEASGQRNDSGPNALHLTDVNTVTGTTGPGSHNASLFTVANLECLTRVDSAALSMQDIDFTVAIWAQWTTLVDGGCLVSADNNAPNRSWGMWPFNNPPFIMSGMVSIDGSAQITFNCGTFGAIATATWYFIVFRHDSVGNQLTIRINNSAGGALAHSTGIFDPTATLRVGARQSNSNNNFNGALAMLGIWKRNLSGAEETTLYNSGSGLSYAEMLATEISPVNITPFTMIKGS